MASIGRTLAAAAVVLVGLIGPVACRGTVPVHAAVPATNAALADAIAALEVDDPIAYQAVLDQIARHGIWMPQLGHRALAERDLDTLDLISFALNAPEPDALLLALEVIEFESDAVAGGPGAEDEIRQLDHEAFAVLEVLDRRSIELPESARSVMGLLPPPGSGPVPHAAAYDTALADLEWAIEATGPPIIADGATPEPGASPRGPTPPPAGVPNGSPDGGLSATNLLLGAIGLLGVALAVFAVLRGRRHDRLADIAFTDGLTGLRNRRRFDSDLGIERERGDRVTAMLMIDIDDFKRFNDAHGHAAGDEVLRRVGDVVSRNVRKHDLPYRYGGEEFCVLLPGTGDDEALVIGERLRQAIEGLHIPLADGHATTVTASVGVASGPADVLPGLVERADQAMYRAKATGRNRTAVA